MNNFEATLLITPETTANKLKSIENLFEKLVKDKGGSLVAKEDWGLRDLSFKINHFKKAFYSFYQLSFEGSKIQDLKNNLSQNEQVLRHLFVKVDQHENLPTKLSKNSDKGG